MELLGRDQENGPNAEKNDRKSERTRQKNKRGYIEKCDQTDSSEIPDRDGQGGGEGGEGDQKHPAFLRGHYAQKPLKSSPGSFLWERKQ